MAAKNGVRMYQRIRRYINKIYLYGFITRKDFAQMHGGSPKDYDVGVKLIKELYTEEGFNQVRGLQSVSRHYFTSGDDRLADSYLFCQLDPQDMAEYLHLLNIARINPGNANHYAQLLQLRPIPERSVGTVYNRMLCLQNHGCLRLQGGTYSLTRDGMDALTDDQLRELYEYVRFCARTTYPRVVAGALRRTLSRKLSARGIRPDSEMPFLLRHNANFHVLDEELVYLLRGCMRNRLWVRFDERLRLPLVLRVDTQMGRWYALCADEVGNAVIERLTNIEVLSPEEKAEAPEKWAQLQEKVKSAYSHTLFSGNNQKCVAVCAKLEFEENPGLRNQFLREIRIGKIVQRDGGEYYEAWISDPQELKPLLRAYGAYLRVLPGDHGLHSELREQYAQMLTDLEEDAL